MQFVNDDMDDELFRRAAEEYPLKTDSGDWNKVFNKLQAGGPTDSSKKGNRSKYLFLLVLIPLFLICTTYIKSDSLRTVAEINQGTKTEVPVTQNEKETILPDQNNLKTQVLNTQVISLEKLQTVNHFSDNAIHHRNLDVTFDKENKGLLTSAQQIKTNRTSSSVITGSLTGNDGEQFNSTNTTSLSKDNVGVPVSDATQNPPTIDADKKIDSDKKELTAKPEEKPETTIANTEKKEKKSKKPANKFYFGFQAGPDFSMVKSANINGAGYSVGLLAGYNFNKKLALETGLLWDRKKYQSEGQYFDAKKLDWPHVTILDLSGYCDMYEIPLNLRYNLSANSRHIFFATAGISSYLMKKENYDYNYVRYGVYAKGSREYKNTTNNWLSVAHLSIGLQKKLGAIGDLRIEPYVKLPVKGVGIGSMPLRSTGIYLGITRPIR